MWLFFKDAITFGDLEALPVWITCAFLILFMVSLSLLLLFAERMRFAVLPFLLGIAPVLYFFGYTAPILAGAAIAALGAMRAFMRVREESKSRINFRVRVLLREGLPNILTVLSLLFAIAYYIETKHAPERITLRDLMPRPLFEQIFQYMPAVGNVVGLEIDSHTTLDQYAAHMLGQNGVDVSLLPSAERSRVLEEARKQLFGSGVGNGDTRLADVFYDIVTQKSENFIAPYERFLPLGFAVAFFLFLRSVALPFGWLVSWMCVGIVHAAVLNGIIIRRDEPTYKEHFVWS
ncbi:MAG: hypothetical protein G01um101470_183 [Parcubacteria group bacterium Gr01-1014_70]|nr:MAG: hypothetical protein G01um101470_183 [Parcubacteria group bacterium Gr01-1014_70]